MPVATDIKIRKNGVWYSLRNQKIRAGGAWKTFGNIRAGGQWYSMYSVQQYNTLVFMAGNRGSIYPVESVVQSFTNILTNNSYYSNFIDYITIVASMGANSSIDYELYRGDANSTDLIGGGRITSNGAISAGFLLLDIFPDVTCTPLELFTLKITKSSGSFSLYRSLTSITYNAIIDGVQQSTPIEIYVYGKDFH